MSATSEPQEFLELFGKRANVIKPGLDRIKAAWQHLGFPGRDTPTILVAGTNGKGSTSGLLWHMLAANDIRAGLFSSPHLISFRERIAITDQAVDNNLLLSTLQEIKTRLPKNLWDDLSFFEINTLLALQVFSAQRTTVNVLEVGLGGRLDCTNIADPLVSIITSIGLDHQEFLGSTTDAVAREKSGIMRPGRPCFWGGVSSSDVLSDQTIKSSAAKLHTPLFIAGEDFLFTSPRHFKTALGKVYEVPSRVQRWPSFLQRNFLMAASAFQAFADSSHLPETLKSTSLSLNTALSRFGETSLPWPTTLKGRFQHVRVKNPQNSHENVRLLIDVCHNPHGARFLSLALTETGLIPDHESRPALLSILSDKDDGGIWATLAGKISQAFLFKIPSERTWSRESTKIPGPMFDSFGECFLDAFSRAELRVDRQQPWLVCGSVAAVGEVFKYFETHGWKLDLID